MIKFNSNLILPTGSYRLNQTAQYFSEGNFRTACSSHFLQGTQICDSPQFQNFQLYEHRCSGAFRHCNIWHMDSHFLMFLFFLSAFGRDIENF